MQKKMRYFLGAEEATTSVEYAVMLALIIMVAITAIATIGNALRDNIFDSSDKLGTALSS